MRALKINLLCDINFCFYTVLSVFSSKTLTKIWYLDIFLLWHALKNSSKHPVLQLGGNTVVSFFSKIKHP